MMLRVSHRSAASGTVKKVIEINPYLLGTMAGGAGQSFVPCVRMFDL